MEASNELKPVVPVQVARPAPAAPQRVVVTNLDISFGNMVMLVLKALPALIVAGIILAVLGGMAAAFIGGMVSAAGR